MEERKQLIRNSIGENFRHFKGGIYQIEDIAIHTETKEEMVIYASLTSANVTTWCRPMDMFIEKVDKKKYPNAIQEYRCEILK